MELYAKPKIYILSHLIFGFAAIWYTWIGILALLWQLGQYIADVRIFAVEGKIEKGNSFEHTALKIAEIGLGASIGLLVFYVLNE